MRKKDYIHEKLVVESICSKLSAKSAEMHSDYIINRLDTVYGGG